MSCDYSLPTFIIGGAARCATTWLRHTVDLHPEIWMTPQVTPEPKFFAFDEEYAKGIDYYRRSYFSSIGSVRHIGEKSTCYLENSRAARRIKKHLPDVRMVFILRNPIERAFDNYIWSKSNGIEELDFMTAITKEQQRQESLTGRLRLVRPFDYVSRGMYSDYLENYFEFFPQEQICCLKYEDIIENPEGFIVQLHEFLQVEPMPEHGTVLGIINSAPCENDEVMPPEAEKWLRSVYQQPCLRLKALLGESFAWW